MPPLSDRAIDVLSWLIAFVMVSSLLWALTS